jgi:hypothetical protein
MCPAYRLRSIAGLQQDRECSSAGSPKELSISERQKVLDLLHADRFIDKAPTEVYGILLYEGKPGDGPHVSYFSGRDARLSFSMVQEICERADERGQIVLDGIPDNGRAEVPVGIDREIPQIDQPYEKLGTFRSSTFLWLI